MRNKDVYFNYYTDSTYYGTNGNYDVDEGWDCCFGKFTKYCDHKKLSQEFNITLWKLRSKVMIDEGHNNVCLFNIREITKHLEEIQPICKFKYKITQYTNRYVINLRINAHALYIKFVLTWIRLLYEFPYNVLYREALKLSTLSSFAGLNLLSIYNLVCSTMYKEVYCSYECGFIYSSRFTEPITYEELKSRMEEFIYNGKYWINHLFTIVENEGLVLLTDLNYHDYSSHLYDIIMGRIPLKTVEKSLQKYYDKGRAVAVYNEPSEDCIKYIRYESNDIESVYEYRYWTSIRNFNERLKAYMTNLTILKDYLKNK